MEENTFSLSFALTELAFVASVLDASPRLLDNPFAGWSTERTEDALRQAQDSLAARQYVQAQPDGSLGLDITVAALVGALAFAESALIVRRVTGVAERTSTRRIHYVAGLIVEHAEGNGTHNLTAVRDGEVVAQRLEKYLRLADQIAPSAEPCTLLAADVEEAHRVAIVEGEMACAAFLAEAGAPPAVAASLAQAMAYPVRQSTLLALAWEEETRRLGGFTLLEGLRGLWLLQPLVSAGEARLDVLPCDAATAGRRVEELVRLIIPAAQE